MALLGTLSLPVVLVLSVGIAFFGYVLPSSIIAAVSGCIWIGYVMYLKRTKPFPSRPILLPADERDIAKNILFCSNNRRCSICSEHEPR